MFVCLRCLFHHILSLTAYTFRVNREFVFIIIVQFMMSANSRIHVRFGLQIVLVWLYSTPSHYHHCWGVYFQFTHFPCVDWDNIYALSYYHHQIGSMNLYPLFRARSWTNCVRCISFYILITRIEPRPCWYRTEMDKIVLIASIKRSRVSRAVAEIGFLGRLGHNKFESCSLFIVRWTLASLKFCFTYSYLSTFATDASCPH